MADNIPSLKIAARAGGRAQSNGRDGIGRVAGSALVRTARIAISHPGLSSRLAGSCWHRYRQRYALDLYQGRYGRG